MKKKLVLSKETLLRLSPPRLREVLGGELPTAYSNCGGGCDTTKGDLTGESCNSQCVNCQPMME
jgi:hypothetical protein